MTNRGGSTVSPIDTATNTAGPKIIVGSGLAGIAITPDGQTAYAVDPGSPGGGVVTPIDTAANMTGGPIAVDHNSLGIAITPDQAPTAAFAAADGTAGSPSGFGGSGSSSVVGTTGAYRWDFGDDDSAITATPQTTHTYATPGTYTTRLTVTDNAGTPLAQVFTGQAVSLQGGPWASITHTVTIAPPPPTQPPTPPPTLPPVPTPTPKPTAPPAVTRVAQSHSPWREGNRRATFAKRTRKNPPLGTRFSFVLNEQARVAFTFVQRLGGRKLQRKCVAQTHHNRRGRVCTRMRTRGILSSSGHTGLNPVGFQGRISPSRKLKPGRYTLTITAMESAGKRGPEDARIHDPYITLGGAPWRLVASKIYEPHRCDAIRPVSPSARDRTGEERPRGAGRRGAH